MRVPMSWLREYVDVDASTEEIAARLAISTCEVERIIVQGSRTRTETSACSGSVGSWRPGSIRTPTVSSSAVSTSARARARSSAARGTSARARPWLWPCPARCSPTARSSPK